MFPCVACLPSACADYETLGESPLVISRLGSAVIRGLQGCGSKDDCEAAAIRGEPIKLAAVGKHAFA
jgi:beta-glucosidase-like glycosyl hydrolase